MKYDCVRHTWLVTGTGTSAGILQGAAMRNALYFGRYRIMVPGTGYLKDLTRKGSQNVSMRWFGEIVAIRGNCDSEVDQMLLDFPILSDYTLLVDNGKRFFLTHGHIYNEDRLPKGRFDCLFMVTPTGGNLNGLSIQRSAIPAPSLSRRTGTCQHSLFTVTVRYPFTGWTAAGSRNFLSDGECIITAYYNCSLL